MGLGMYLSGRAFLDPVPRKNGLSEGWDRSIAIKYSKP